MTTFKKLADHVRHELRDTASSSQERGILLVSLTRAVYEHVKFDVLDPRDNLDISTPDNTELASIGDVVDAAYEHGERLLAERQSAEQRTGSPAGTAEWTRAKVVDLVRYARERHPGWEWALTMRPATAVLCENGAGIDLDPDPRVGPSIQSTRVAGCDVMIPPDLIGAFVTVSPIANNPSAIEDRPPTYWLDLATDVIDEWTEDDFRRFQDLASS